MRRESDCDEYNAQAQRVILARCAECEGTRTECGCRTAYKFACACYEACIPTDFWRVKPEGVTHNVDAFRAVVQAYADRLGKARRKGYGLLLLGDNGVGKTMFLSYVLTQAIMRGWTAYYTTVPQLDYDLKRGFGDQESRDRLDLMLTSDFLALDEMGKEHMGKGETDTWMRTQVERILKERFDSSLPVLLATNADMETLARVYGPTVASMLEGKYAQATLEPGDHRRKVRERMEADMGRPAAVRRARGSGRDRT